MSVSKPLQHSPAPLLVAPPPGGPRPPGPTFEPVLLNARRMSLPGSAARRISTEVQSRIEAVEQRKRKRRAKDARTFSSLIDMLVSNLVRFHLIQRDDAITRKEGILSGGLPWIGVYLAQEHLGSKHRYDKAPVPQWSRTDLITAMNSLDLLILDKAPRHPDAKRPSHIRPGPALLTLIARHNPTLGDFTEAEGGEVILLRDIPKVVFVKHRKSGKHVPRKIPGALIDYRDTDRTKAWRRELEQINAWLQQAEITCDAELAVSEHIRLHGEPPKDPLPKSVAVHERRMCRIFNRGRFTAGGRLGGPFWHNMKKETRLGLRIVTPAAPQGEPFVALDYSSMFLQLLYTVKAGLQTPGDEGDLYEGIVGVGGEYGAPWPNDSAERKALRNAIKANANKLLFWDPSKGPCDSVAQGTRHQIDPSTNKADPARYIIPKNVSGTELFDRIRRRHPAIADCLQGSEVGFELMHHESEIIMGILRRCCDAGVVVLPLHDGLLVPQSQWQVAREAMHLAFYTYTGSFFEIVDGPKSADGESDTMLRLAGCLSG